MNIYCHFIFFYAIRKKRVYIKVIPVIEMGILGKKGVETIDYTLLQKKGFIKKKEEQKTPYSVDSQGMVDLTGNAAKTDSMSADSSSSPFGFLDSLAGASSSNSSASHFDSNGGVEINAIRIKIDDLEYKLSNLLEKLALIESKLDNFERKVG